MEREDFERDRFKPYSWYPREPGDEPYDLSIAGERFNILDILRHGARLSFWAGKMKPGDDRAQDLIRTFTNMGVTPEEYRTAMPKLLHLAAKEEGGFDADFLDVTRFIMRQTESRRGGEDPAFKSKPDRLAYFAEVYGQVHALKAFVWRYPELADHKEKIVTHAKKYLERDRPKA